MSAPRQEQEPRAGSGSPTPTRAAEEGFAAWNSGSCERFLATVHPDIVWSTAGLFPGLRSEYKGHDGMRTFWEEFTGPWEELQIEAKRIVEPDDDCVLALVGFKARGRDGIEVDLEFVNHMVIRDGLLIRYQGYASWDEALAELGIAESDLPAGD